jgi:hypothetical protein
MAKAPCPTPTTESSMHNQEHNSTRRALSHTGRDQNALQYIYACYGHDSNNLSQQNSVL